MPPPERPTAPNDIDAFRQAVHSHAGPDEVTPEVTAIGIGSRMPPPSPGDIIGHYELIRALGRGGMGEVFLARDIKLGRRVAMKFLGANDPEVGRRFIEEARNTALCNHENIVIIYEADEAAGRHYMVLEYLQGQVLTDFIRENQASPRAVELMLPVVRALVCAHQLGIVHRDLKPENIFVTDSGTVKVLDFGIAKMMHAEPAQQPHAPMVGTLSYMAPEQWSNAAIDHRADIWAVGLILFKLLSGRHPIDGRRAAELSVTSDLSVPMPSLRSVAPAVSEALAEVVDRCLQKDKDKRYPDAQALLRALEPLEAGRVNRTLKVGETPYAGLSSFQEGDSARFFGRTRETAALVNKLRSQSLVAVVGSSGAGKSSFIRAGLLPALKRSGEAWQAVVVRPSRRPLEMLVDALLQLGDYTGEHETDLTERERLMLRLRAEPGYVGARFRAHARQHGLNIVLFVDQFEELYTQVAESAERLLFTTCLGSIADDATSPARVVLSLRSDFLDRVTEDKQFMAELSEGLFFLNAPTRESLAEALVQPAEMAGYHFESNDIIEDMLAHLQATQGALPLLQFTASKLWDARDANRHLLTMASYRAFGGIAGALAAHADSVIQELSASSQAIARAVLPRLVTPERTRALVSLDELRDLSNDKEAVNQVVNQLVRARLLMVQTNAGSATVELVHESLISGWPLLRRWLDEGREDQAFREQLRTAARQWEAKNRAPGLLWRGEAMEEARLWRSRHADALPEKESAFLRAVFALATRSSRTTRAVVGGIIAMLLALVAGGAVALVQVQNAERQALEQARIAKSEADRAKSAETRVTEQLVRLREEQLATAQAEAEVARSKGDLREVNKRLESALDIARVESQAARASANKANELASSLQNANAELSKLLAAERTRAEQLERERKKITTELR